MTNPKPAPAPAPAPRPAVTPAAAPAPAPARAPAPVAAPLSEAEISAVTPLSQEDVGQPTPLSPEPEIHAINEPQQDQVALNPQTSAPVRSPQSPVRQRRTPSHLIGGEQENEGVAVIAPVPQPPSSAGPERGEVESDTGHQGEEPDEPLVLSGLAGVQAPNDVDEAQSVRPEGAPEHVDERPELVTEVRQKKRARPAFPAINFPRKAPAAEGAVKPASLFRTPAGRAGLIALGGLLVLLPVSLLLRQKPDTLPPVVGAPPVITATPGTPPVPVQPAPSTNVSAVPPKTTQQQATRPNTPTPVNKASGITPNKAAAIKTVDTANAKAATKPVDPTTQADVRQALVTPDPNLAGTFKVDKGGESRSQTSGILPARVAPVTIAPPSGAARPTTSASSAAPVSPRLAQPAPNQPIAEARPQITYAPPRYVTPPSGTAQPVVISPPTSIRSSPPATVTLTTPVELGVNGPVKPPSAAPAPVVVVTPVATPGATTAPSTPVTTSPVEALPAVSYLGYAEGEGGRVAVVEAGTSTESVTVGGMIAGAQVTEITSSHITLKDKGGSHQIPLEVNQ